ncbi:MAG: class I tRNA ligase family protein [Patescibacteria group bacterium]
MFIKDIKNFNLPESEKKVLDYWKKNQIFERSLSATADLRKKERGLTQKRRKIFVFYEGPPTANGRPGIHHVIARVFKDVILRYKTMRGYFVPRKAGWDTHGLPVEIQVEKALGLKSKKEIEKYGIAEFNQKCRESVWQFKDEFEKLTERMGYWLDMKNPYVTYEKDYIESLWWVISQFWKKKLLYKGNKIVNWCPRCGTGLSSHEMALGYKEVVDNSVYVKFKLKKGQKIGDYKTDDKTYILSWTTTPWTLPGNVALAVKESIQYEAVKVIKIDGNLENLDLVEGETYIFADTEEAEMRIFQKKVDWGKDNNAQVQIFVSKGVVSDEGKFGSKINVSLKKVGAFSGEHLLGGKYEPLFDVAELSKNKNAYKVYLAGFVTDKDGMGVVHTAVMYGEDDYKLGMKVGLPQHHTVDEAGKFTKDVKGFASLIVKSKDKKEEDRTTQKIFEYLKKQGNFLLKSEISHQYPHCWRCSTPLLYYARSAWFVAMSKLKKELITNNNTINWIPAHMKEGRFGEWLKDVKDWNFSRERYWGTPLPIWECKKCGATEVVSGLEELDKKASGTRNEYLLMRHGESEAVLAGVIDSGEGKYHVTNKGKEQVERAARDLSKSGVDLIFSSDVLRTKETANIVAKSLGAKEVVFDKRLREINMGVIDGKPVSEYAKILPTLESRFEAGPEGGESLKVLRTRLWDFIKETDNKYKNKKILIVSHEYPIWMLNQAMMGWTQSEAISEMGVRGKTFIKTGQVVKPDLKVVPRDETGEVDLHRPYVDEILLRCSKCKGEMKRVKELCDVWFDSGSMPFGQVHWPFDVGRKTLDENQKTPNVQHLTSDALEFPADYICEAVDQTRGWFYTLLAVATALGKGAPYKNVISLGHINDKYGQKMSKSKGNVVDPWVMAEKYGMDAVRWYFYTATPPGEPKNFDEQEILKTYRRFHLILWNSLVFYKTYADKKLDVGRKTLDGENKTPNTQHPTSNVLDQWILARLDETVQKATKHFDKYEVREAALAIESLVDDLSRWYIRRSRRRLQKPESKQDYEACSATLGYVISEVLKMMAPFNPFFSEVLWNVLGNKDSVHLTEWPKSQIANRKSQIIKQMEEVRRLATLGLAKRAEAGIKVRQPLAKLSIKSKAKSAKLNQELLEILAEEVNVKKVAYDTKLNLTDAGEIELDTKITAELRGEGILRELVRAIQELRQKAGLSSNDRVVLMFELPEELKLAVSKGEGWLKKEVGAKSINYGKSDKFSAVTETKIEDKMVWVGIRKI